MRTLLRSISLVLLLAAGFGLAGCGDGDRGVEVDGAAAELSAAELGRLGAHLDQEPERAEELLDEAGLTWEDFEAAVRRVSADTGEARRYAKAFAKAGGETTPEPEGENEG